MPSGPAFHGILLNQPARLQSPPIPTPSHPTGGVFTLSASTTIQAPALSCVAIALDPTAYASWSRPTSCASLVSSPPPDPEADPVLQPIFARSARPGSVIRLATVLRPGWVPVTIKITIRAAVRFHDVEGRSGWRIIWAPRSVPGVVSWTERVQEFIEVSDGNGDGVVTEYTLWETFGGVAAHIMKATLTKDLVGSCESWMDDLKREAERQARAAREPEENGPLGS
ncbi:hypothetical protein Cpir12675_002893 [Ceratocystis pirilliformis]|uniref:Coenzyme Q-binding protein COQ10 START domain-containing protein n=1 Tax=Ceratocystis pirilliformis TaxID=259994 RepID=A0ABR3Z836_9PEZI